LVAASATPLVLAILAEGDSYGYAIIKRVTELSGGHLQWTDGMLYPVLQWLERQGHVAAKWSTARGRLGGFLPNLVRCVSPLQECQDLLLSAKLCPWNALQNGQLGL